MAEHFLWNGVLCEIGTGLDSFKQTSEFRIAKKNLALNEDFARAQKLVHSASNQIPIKCQLMRLILETALRDFRPCFDVLTDMNFVDRDIYNKVLYIVLSLM